ncbi:MAG: molybdopterin dinucleotide binding domain-containing protein, partial [Chloroflexota bacterium]|nr:molybdopterin dinucleotide binding domain-containing protein [Chloroflexota bacterium]
HAAADTLTGGRGAAALESFRPEEAARVTGVEAETIREMAREFAHAKASVALGGGLAGASTNGAANLAAILALNLLVNNLGKPGGVQFSAAPPIRDLPVAERVTPLKEWEAAAKRMQEGKVGLALVHGADPVHGLPAYSGFADGLSRVPHVASFSSFMDDTTAQADLVLPDHSPLEAWGDDVPNPGLGYPTLGIQQPVVQPLHDTLSFADSLLALAERLGGKVRDALPWNNLKEAIQDGARQLQQTGRGSVQSMNFDAFWNGVLQRGGWWDDSTRATVKASDVKLPTSLKQPTFAGTEGEYPYHLIVFPTNIGDGRDAHLPWLQALGDPVSSIAWQTWVELNPGTAQSLGVVEGDIAEVESLYGKIEAPVYVNPAAPPDVVSIPTGQGHSAYGRYAEKRGANVMSILAPLTDEETGGLAWAATRVKLRPTGANTRLVKYEGNVTPVQDEEHPIVQTTGPV